MYLRMKTVSALPAAIDRTPLTLYMVKNGTRLDTYFTSATSELFTGMAYNEMYAAIMTDVNTAIGTALTTATELNVVADLTALAAYSTASGATSTLIAMVVNPRVGAANVNTTALTSGDMSVTSGSATYIWDSGIATWFKISEQESMDLVLSWDNLQGKPTSTVALIDQAVTDSHTHANMHIINLFGIDTDGALMYNGNKLVIHEEV